MYVWRVLIAGTQQKAGWRNSLRQWLQARVGHHPHKGGGSPKHHTSKQQAMPSSEAAATDSTGQASISHSTAMPGDAHGCPASAGKQTASGSATAAATGMQEELMTGLAPGVQTAAAQADGTGAAGLRTDSCQPASLLTQNVLDFRERGAHSLADLSSSLQEDSMLSADATPSLSLIAQAMSDRRNASQPSPSYLSTSGTLLNMTGQALPSIQLQQEQPGCVEQPVRHEHGTDFGPAHNIAGLPDAAGSSKRRMDDTSPEGDDSMDAQPAAEPVFVPIVLRMDAKDHALLLEEWCSRQQVFLSLIISRLHVPQHCLGEAPGLSSNNLPM